MIRLRLLLVSLVLLPGVSASEHAAPRAVIVVGLTANESQAARLNETAASLREGFLARGLTADAIATLAPSAGAPLRRDTVLSALAPVSAGETWIVLLGTAAPGRDGRPAFQLSGPRLTADDLAKTVAALPGKKFVVVATSASGGFLPPLLALPDVEATAATADSGEISEPRFAGFWAEALVAQPHASFGELAAAAADRVAAYYGEHSLAQSETARLIDHAAGKIIEAPFAAAGTASASPAAANSAPAPSVDIAKLTFPKPRTRDEVERRPADDESRALLAAGRAAAKDSSDAAVILRTEAEIVVARDFSSRETWRTRAYLRTGEALDDLGTLRLPSDPPFTTATLVSARVIRPDGAQRLLNPAARSARLSAETDAKREQKKPDPAPPFIELPEVTADCVVEAEWTIDRRADGELPEFYNEWHLAERYPQRSLHVRLSIPREARWRAFAPNIRPGFLHVERHVNTPANDIYLWDLADLPAFAPLPGDAPARTFAPWLGVSSVASWDTFAAWYRRLAAGSDTAGPGIDALAAEIGAAHADRAGRLRAAYERVAALRYVAVELGVGAFRPRTPEQVWTQRYGDCKDKANLLVAVLAKLGIPAEFALVNRYDATFTDLPGWQFNHAVALVPAAPADGQPLDLWLDTTDRLVPFGIVAPGDLGRQALVFTRDFSSAAFHEITAAQEPKSEWNEFFHFDAKDSTWRLRLWAKGSAEVTLRRMFAAMPSVIRAERIQSLLLWRYCVVQQVTTSDPYDTSIPFVATIKIVGTADSMKQNMPRALVPGLEFFSARVDQHSEDLWWDEGRTWTFCRGQEDVGIGTEIPGHVPAHKPGGNMIFLSIP